LLIRSKREKEIAYLAVKKRAGINLTKETSFKKLKNLKCLACDIRGYTLPNY